MSEDEGSVYEEILHTDYEDVRCDAREAHTVGRQFIPRGYSVNFRDFTGSRSCIDMPGHCSREFIRAKVPIRITCNQAFSIAQSKGCSLSLRIREGLIRG